LVILLIIWVLPNNPFQSTEHAGTIFVFESGLTDSMH
jgi:hypothetical protein